MSGVPQHMQALDRANMIRLGRAQVKRNVAAGEVTVAEVVLACPPEVETMMLSDLITAQRRWGRTRMLALLRSTSLSEFKTVGSLTERQRAVFVEALEPTAHEPAPSVPEPPAPAPEPAPPVLVPPARDVEDDVARKRAANPRLCNLCAERMRPDPSGLCGFCLEQAAGRRRVAA